MNEFTDSKSPPSKLEKETISLPPARRGPGRGVGEKRIYEERRDELKTLFSNLQQVQIFLNEEGHSIINESGSLLTSQSHENLDQLIALLDDFLWILNCALAKHGGDAKIF
ncbi:MAG: hypothetical protein ACFFD8_06295 [Candidatus Thorarchaeota archaeon]